MRATLRLVLVFLTELTLAACGTATSEDSEKKDIATNATSGRVHLYYAEDNTIVRATCDSNSSLYNHDTCRGNIQRVPEQLLYEELSLVFGGERASLEQLVTDTNVKILQIDAKLRQFLDNQPDLALPDIKDKIAKIETHLIEVELKVTEFADQVARLEAKLAIEEDADLRLQWRLASERRAQEVMQREALRSERNDLWNAFIKANAKLIDEATFKALSARRDRLASDLQWTKVHLEREIKELIRLNRAMKYIEDTTFVYEHVGSTSGFDTQDVAAALERAFDAVDERLRTFEGTPSASKLSVHINVTRAARVALVECAFKVEQYGEWKTVVRGPGNFSSFAYHSSFTLGHGVTAGNWPQEFERILDWPALGGWDFMLTGPGAAPTVSRANCKIRVDK